MAKASYEVEIPKLDSYEVEIPKFDSLEAGRTISLELSLCDYALACEVQTRREMVAAQRWRLFIVGILLVVSAKSTKKTMKAQKIHVDTHVYTEFSQL